MTELDDYATPKRRSGPIIGVVVALLLGLCCVVGAIAVFLIPHSRPQIYECNEYDYHDRKLPNSYRFRIMTTCAYRIKWGPDFVVLPTTGTRGEHGILEVAVMGDTVIGPIVDTTNAKHPILSWFWLDTKSREFNDKLSKDELSTILESKGLAVPDKLTPVESLPDYPWGG